jgi:hypothetical protein
MGKTGEKFKKVTFRYFSDVLEEEVVETMWAEIINEDKGIYKLDSIPFYGPPIATDDLFFSEFDEDEKTLVFRNVIEHSGNSIIQVVIMAKDYDKEVIREELKRLDCLSEGLNEKYFSVEIGKNIDYKNIKLILENYKNRGVLDYAEPMLSEKHSNDI